MKVIDKIKQIHEDFNSYVKQSNKKIIKRTKISDIEDVSFLKNIGFTNSTPVIKY